MLARWVDLGAPASSQALGVFADIGWFADDLRPTLTVSLPRAGHGSQPLGMIRIGAFDYYSGLDKNSLSVTANFPINGNPPGTELASGFSETGDHIWTMTVDPPITSLNYGLLTVRVQDVRGNVTTIARSLSRGTPDTIPPAPPINVQLVISPSP